MWALTEWLPDGEQLIASRQYRYTSSVVTGEVDLEDYSVTWHITPETVDGFAVTNIPALVTTSMFSAKEGLSREELLVVLLHHLGLKADASPLEVKAEMLKLKRFTAAGETASDAEADTPPPSDGAEADGEADGEEAGAGEAGPGEPAPPPPAAEPPVDELALTRTELATARKRIADLEVEAGAAFVKSLPHSGKLTPAQRKAAEDQARTPTGLARRRGRRARRGGRCRHRSQHSQKVASTARWGGGCGEGSERLSRATDDPPRAVRGELSSLQYSGTPETTCPFGQIRSDRGWTVFRNREFARGAQAATIVDDGRGARRTASHEQGSHLRTARARRDPWLRAPRSDLALRPPDHCTMDLGEQYERGRSVMMKLRPWKGSKHEFEVDVIVNGPQGRALRRRVKAPVSGKSNAERWARSLEQELLAQLLAPEPEPEKPPAPTFEEFAVSFLDLCKADRLGVNTWMNYDVHLRHYLLPVLARRRLNEVKPTDITAIKSALATKSHNTMCEVLKTLRRIFNRAIMQKLIERPPVDFDIPRRNHKLPVAYDEREQALLLAAAQTLGPMYVALVVLGFDGGLRRGEILGLQWSDLDFKRMLMSVRHNIVRGKLDVPKGRTEDEVGITRRLADALTALPRTGPFVFDNGGNHYKDHNIKAWLTTILRYAGLPWRGTHILRKTCGTRIADNGGGVSAVASHLRHKSLQTASRYIDRRGGTSRALKALES